MAETTDETKESLISETASEQITEQETYNVLQNLDLADKEVFIANAFADKAHQLG
jgi:hypothetical protein